MLLTADCTEAINSIPMHIGQLAKRAGIAINIVRHHERSGILPPPQRQASGYRSHGDQDVARLRFLRRAKALGFRLIEIRELPGLPGRRGDDRAGHKSVAMGKPADVERRLAELERIRHGLKALVASCPGHGALDTCPILAALAEEDA